MIRGRERIYAVPVRWTARHLQLLNCQFFHVLPRDGDDFPALSLPIDFADEAFLKRLTDSLRVGPLPPGTEHWNGALLKNKENPDYPFRFGFNADRITIPMKAVDCLFTADPRGGTPILAYLNFNAIGKHRKETIGYPGNKRCTNPICDRIYQAKLCQYTPENKAEDPYIAAVLIALAQQKRIHEVTEAKNHDGKWAAILDIVEREYTVHVLAVQPDVPDDSGANRQLPEGVYLYTATIPGNFLSRLNAPNHLFPSNLGFHISYYRLWKISDEPDSAWYTDSE
ncbi:hypothetical protein B0H67DRAFT_99207 [Lasiosphaeris hirsuta]|uniref:Uncharacterized protein n=1 Tax=Lasiosphaeris hirsuta TaxID=260670 RepID=A0AA40AXX9_9PEZI|nr:hypothetical protein B0H67DRAFT_99207 [Lasiosphaeris hirsuta]